MAIFLIADSEILQDNPELDLVDIMRIISDNKIKKFKSAIIAGEFPEKFTDFMRRHFIFYKDRCSIDDIFIKDVFLMYYMEVQKSNKDRFVYLTNNKRFIEVNKILKNESNKDNKPLKLELYFWKEKTSDELINSVDKFIPLELLKDISPLEFTDKEDLPDIDLSEIPSYNDFPDNNSYQDNLIEGV